MRALGVDGCKGGWIGVVLDDEVAAAAWFATSISEIVRLAGSVDTIGIDMPIHLNDDRDRPCDGAARRALSPHGSRVFNAPVTSVLTCETYEEANAASARALGKKISRQTWGLVPKIAEVERWLPAATCSVYEVHPEVTFAAMAGAVIGPGKKTRDGATARVRTLTEHGITIPSELRATDDLLDACAAAWSARRIARGEGRCLPDQPPVVRGWQQAIWL